MAIIITRRAKREAPVLDFEVTYKNYEKLSRFLTERAKILGRSRSGLTAKQQRRVSLAIKRARHLGLLPFTPSL